MVSDYNLELKQNQKVSKINNFYQKIVHTITHFEWCQTCKHNATTQITAYTASIQDDSSFPDDKEDTILGETLVERFKNRVIAPGSAIDGRGGAIDDSRIQTRTHEVPTDEESARARDILCNNLCMKKYFEMQVKIKQEFNNHRDIFD